MNHRKSSLGRSRDFGIPGGPGKGDKSRVTNQSDYAANFEAINWGPRKSPPPSVYVENETEWKHIPDNLPPRAEVDLGGKVVNQIPVTNDLIRE